MVSVSQRKKGSKNSSFLLVIPYCILTITELLRCHQFAEIMSNLKLAYCNDIYMTPSKISFEYWGEI